MVVVKPGSDAQPATAMRIRPASNKRASRQTRRTAGCVDIAAPTNKTTTTTPPTMTVGRRSSNGKYANTTLLLAENSGSDRLTRAITATTTST